MAPLPFSSERGFLGEIHRERGADVAVILPAKCAASVEQAGKLLSDSSVIEVARKMASCILSPLLHLFHFCVMLQRTDGDAGAAAGRQVAAASAKNRAGATRCIAG